MNIPSHNLNSQHRDALRSVLERKSVLVYADNRNHNRNNATVPVGGVRGFLHSMSTRKKWGIGMTAFSLSTGIAIAVIIASGQPQLGNVTTLANLNNLATITNLAPRDFIAAAQAVDQADTTNQNGVVHQRYVMHMEGPDTATENMTIERWLHNGEPFAAADIVTFADGHTEKTVEVTHNDGTRHMYTDQPVEVAATAEDAPPPPDPEDTTHCIVNPNDYPELQGDAERQEITNALEVPASRTRQAILEDLSTNPNVTDLGEQDGTRRLRVSTTEDITLVYAFDSTTYALQEYTESRTSEPAYTYTYTYLVDETLDVQPGELPIFTDLNGLTEMAVDSNEPDLNGKPSGCYDNNGERIGDVYVEFCEDGSMSMSETPNEYACMPVN